MSAILAFVQHDRISILTDGAVYSDDGRLAAVKEKCLRSDHLPLAITARGDAAFCDATLAAILKMAEITRSVDRVLDFTADLLAGYRTTRETTLPDRHIELLIAAFSETRGPSCFVAVTHDFEVANGLEPYILRQWMLPFFGMGPAPSEVEIESAGITAEAAFAAGAEFPRRFGADIMEIMRRKPAQVDRTNPSAVHGYGIGGHCQLTTVTASGAATETLRTWPDSLGVPINPYSGEGSVLPLLNSRRKHPPSQQGARVGRIRSG